MFALVAFIIALLGAFGIGLGSTNMALLAFAFLCLHFAFNWTPWVGVVRRNG
jgi:hypothetical protein